MSLPTIIIFERHWDTIPKLLVKDLLPDLVKQGYDTLCFEAPQNLTQAEFVERHNIGLEANIGLERQAKKYLKRAGIIGKLSDMSFDQLSRLMQLYVSSQRYINVAEKIKDLPASRILKDIFDEAVRLHVSLKGIDIDSANFDAMTSLDLTMRSLSIDANEDNRITTIFKNLLKLREQQEEGVIFVCGALHASGLLAKFKERNMQDEVLHYFPHSSNRYDDRFDDARYLAMNDTLRDHTHLLSPREVRLFGKKIVKEITSKIKYKREILDGNSHCQVLSDCFKINFRAFVRPGYLVDALVDFDAPDIESIRKRVNDVGVQTHDVSLDGRRYLVVPGVNIRETAHSIRTIQPERV
jgi:hypothetical protein